MGVVLFDLDNTLFDRSGAYRRWAEVFVHGRALGPGEVEWFCRADDDGFAPRQALFEMARERYSLPESSAELVRQYRIDYPGVMEPDEAVRGALVRLRGQGWRIGVVTNGPVSQRDKLDRLGLSDLIDGLAISDEVGWAKPASRVFEHALRQCGADVVDSSSMWMVGDAPGPDIGGAQALGMRTIWIDRGRPWPETASRPDAVVREVPEAAEVLLSDAAPMRAGAYNSIDDRLQ